MFHGLSKPLLNFPSSKEVAFWLILSIFSLLLHMSGISEFLTLPCVLRSCWYLFWTWRCSWMPQGASSELSEPRFQGTISLGGQLFQCSVTRQACDMLLSKVKHLSSSGCMVSWRPCYLVDTSNSKRRQSTKQTQQTERNYHLNWHSCCQAMYFPLLGQGNEAEAGQVHCPKP